jgi:hypothetical protein
MRVAWQKAFGSDFDKHESVNHSAGEYVRGGAHTNTIEGYFSILSAASSVHTIMSASNI